MLNSSIRDFPFDPIEFELEREEIFARTLRVGVEYAACDAAFPPTEKIICSSKYSRYSADYSDGEFDGKLGFEPSLEKWSSPDYKRGYLAGIEEKYNDRFAQLI